MADRHQFRANWHPYDEGLYFVTICCADKRHLFGKIVGAQFIASTLGSLVKENIEKIPSYYNDVEIPNHVVMPNHIHMVISRPPRPKLPKHPNRPRKSSDVLVEAATKRLSHRISITTAVWPLWSEHLRPA